MLSMLFQLEQSQWLSAPDLWTHQRRQLRALLGFAAARVPFYRDRIAAQVARLSAAFSPQEFARLPLLTRADIQQHFPALYTEQLPAGHGGTTQAATSGSTGEPIRYVATTLSSFFWQAFMLREHLWHRRDLAAKMLAVRAEMKEISLANWFGDVGSAFLDTGRFVILPARWSFDRQLDRILEERPAYVLGYASNVLGIFQTAEQRGVKMPWLREARSFGEAIPAQMRAYFREHWQLPLTDVYTARETGYLALQCPQGDGYHVQSESAIVEVLNDDDAPCGPGETGRIVVTPLHNFAMPLIRYDIGDYAEVGAPCACGRGLPVLRQIRGRMRNILRMPDGSRRWPTLGTAKLLDIAPVRRIKIVQKSFQDIEVWLIVGRPLEEREIAGLTKHLTEQFGYPFRWRFLFFDEFPPQPGDKFEDFVSEVS